MYTDAYRVIQEGTEVARSEGPHALRTIMAEANVYRQDGPLSIQRRVNRRWQRWGEMMPVAVSVGESDHAA